MANIRKIRTKVLRTFADFCSTFLNMLLAICKNATRIDLVFDSYKEISVKDTERSRRSTMKPIEISMIAEDTPLPVNMDTFWTSVSNKVKFQMFLRKGMIENAANMYPIGWNSVQMFQSLKHVITLSVTNRRLFDVIIRVGLYYRRGRCVVSTTCNSCNTDWSQETCHSIWWHRCHGPGTLL